MRVSLQVNRFLRDRHHRKLESASRADRRLEIFYVLSTYKHESYHLTMEIFILMALTLSGCLGGLAVGLVWGFELGYQHQDRFCLWTCACDRVFYGTEKQAAHGKCEIKKVELAVDFLIEDVSGEERDSAVLPVTKGG